MHAKRQPGLSRIRSRCELIVRDADVQLEGDLGVGPALGDQGDQLPFPGAELARDPAPIAAVLGR